MNVNIINKIVITINDKDYEFKHIQDLIPECENNHLKYDYYYLKKLKTNPDFEEVLDYALEAGLSVYDVEQLYAVLGTEKPDCL